jgi:queuosine precursor transporter
MTVRILVVCYLLAIVAANLSVAQWGPTAAIYNAFFFIGLDLTCRDRLHDLWRGQVLRNMALLIAAGSALSYLAGLWIGTGPEVGRIALASCVAFATAASADALAYHLLRERGWYERVNQSNIIGAAVDSLLFVALWPFGFQFTLAFTLFAAKVAGGVVWSFVLSYPRRSVVLA